MSSILSTSVCGVGTQTTSLPACPDLGSKGCCFLSRRRLRERADGQQADPKGQPGPPDHPSCIHRKLLTRKPTLVSRLQGCSPTVRVGRGSKTAQDNTLRQRACLPGRTGGYNRGLSAVQQGRSPSFTAVAEQLVQAGRRFDERGWVLGTSGNFSAVISRAAAAGDHAAAARSRARWRADQILEIDEHGRVPVGAAGKPSAETLLHLEIVGARGAGAVLHTHSVWSTMLSDRHARRGGLAIEGYEMLKGLDGVRTHEHREWMPIVENDQDMARLAGRRARHARRASATRTAFLLRAARALHLGRRRSREAERHVEILEFLFETRRATRRTGQHERMAMAQHSVRMPWPRKIPADKHADDEVVATFLAAHGIDYEHWAPSRDVAADAPAEAVLAAYAHEDRRARRRAAAT